MEILPSMRVFYFANFRKCGDVDVLSLYATDISSVLTHPILYCHHTDDDSDSDAETSRRQRSNKCTIVWEVSLVTTSHQLC